MDKINADLNATGFFYMALVFCLESEQKNVQIFYDVDLETLKTFHPPWLDTKEPIGFYAENKQEEKEKNEKTIEKFKTNFLENVFSEITIICAQADDASPTMIVDGSHRSIAVLRALKENEAFRNKIRIRCILLTGEKLINFNEYSHLLKKE